MWGVGALARLVQASSRHIGPQHTGSMALNCRPTGSRCPRQSTAPPYLEVAHQHEQRGWLLQLAETCSAMGTRTHHYSHLTFAGHWCKDSQIFLSITDALSAPLLGRCPPARPPQSRAPHPQKWCAGGPKFRGGPATHPTAAPLGPQHAAPARTAGCTGYTEHKLCGGGRRLRHIG